MTNQVARNVINAAPTKNFFINMLVKDIGLMRAIIDLVDNSVDGARRITDNGRYDDLTVRIEADPDHFRLIDNCGGIPVDIARNYAFRFGRPPGMPETRHSVGHVGVGMKRALFKLGKEFRIQSSTEASRFVVAENIDEWREREDWLFEFKELEEAFADTPAVQRGTDVLVTQLHEGVSAEFANENFQTRLAAEIESAHQDTMDRGLAISLNQVPLRVRLAELRHSSQLRPAYREMTFEAPSVPPVTVKIYAGISTSEPSAAGWYLFCNGRLVLEADQTLTTGWGEGGGTTIPKYHNQFAMFRGYVFFDSDDAGLLPWNTTKTGVDEDSPKYRAARLDMINLMRPVIDFLNKLHDEKDRDDKPLETAVEKAAQAKLHDVPTATTFLAPPRRPLQTPARLGRIQYSKPSDQIDQVKDALAVTTLREVGELTFDYFFKMECEV